MRADIKELASIRSLWVIPICAILAHISSVSLISFFLDKVDQPADVPYEQLTASGLFMVMIGIYGTLASTGVLSRNSIALEMLVQPRRGTVMATKASAVAVMVTAASIIGYGVTHPIMIAIIKAHNVPCLSYGLTDIAKSLGLFILTALFVAFLGYCFGFIFISPAGGVIAVFVIQWGTGMITGLVGLIPGLKDIVETVYKYLPVHLEGEIQDLNSSPADWFKSFAFILIWCAVVYIFGLFRFRKYVPCR